MNGFTTPDGLWLPGVRKPEGGSQFDDELKPAKEVYLQYLREMCQHLNQRPDHMVYVGTSEDRKQLREVFNWMKREGVLIRNPTIKIDYGVPEGQVRIDEER